MVAARGGGEGAERGGAQGKLEERVHGVGVGVGVGRGGGGAVGGRWR